MPHRKIKAKRKEQGLSQDDMADRLGISPSAYGKIERGTTRIDIDRLKQIAETLETNVIDLLEKDTIVITHSGDNNKNGNGVVIQPMYDADSETCKQLIKHLESDVATLRQENDRLLRLVERLTGGQS